MKVEFHKHNLGTAEADAVAKAMQSPMITGGTQVPLFEKEFGTYFDSEYPREIVAVSSGTSALQLALMALDVEGKEVITPALSFMATANAILHAGGIPVFVDVDETGNIDIGKAEQKITSKTRAILPVHLYGQMVNMYHLGIIGTRYGLAIIEDSCQCIEGYYDHESRDHIYPGRSVACFSFHALKTLTCGEGGAILTWDKELAQRLRTLRSHGITRSVAQRQAKYSSQDIKELGLKATLSDLNAAILIPQLPHLKERHQKRISIAQQYLTELRGVGHPEIKDINAHAWTIYSIWVRSNQRNRLVDYLRDHGVGCTVQFSPSIPSLTYYREQFDYSEHMFPTANRIASQTIALPIYPQLAPEEIAHVIATVNQGVTELNASI